MSRAVKVALSLLLPTLAAVGALIAFSLGSAALAADPDLSAEWHLDQVTCPPSTVSGNCTTPDSSGNGNTGQIGGGATQVAGRFDQALSFNGTGFGVLVPASATLQPGTVTAMAWVNHAGSPGTGRYVLGQGASACNAASYALYTDGDGGLRFYVFDGNQFYASPSIPAATVWNGQWHAVAGVYDGNAVRLYVDGQEVGSGTPFGGTIDYAVDNKTFTIGNYANFCRGITTAFVGSIDEVRVYHRALGADELNYLQTAGGSTPPELPPPTTTTTTTASSTTTTTTTTTGGGGGGSIPPQARFIVPGPSSTLTHGIWFNGAASLGTSIIDYAWDTNGDGKFDWHCGRSPIAAIAFTRPGEHTVGLRITNVAGQTSTFSARVTVSKATLAGIRMPTPVFDCENPNAGNQPDRADCVKSFGFGIIDANSRGRPEDCFQISGRFNPNALHYVPPLVHGAAPDITPVARASAREPPRAKQAFKRNPFLIYHATLKGPVAVNGLLLEVPESNQSEYDTGDQSVTLGHVNVGIGSYQTHLIDFGHVVAVPDSHGIVHVSDVLLKGANAAFGALPIQGSVSIDLTFHASRTRIHLKLPPPFSLSRDTPAQADLYLISDNVNGLQIDGARLGPLDTWIGPVWVKNLTFRYLRSQNLWEGGADLFFPGSPVGLNAAQPPPDAGFGLRNGRFDHAGVGLDFLPGAQPELFPGIFLTNLHVAIGTNPLRFTGGGAISAAEIYTINGDVFVAFASPDQPYEFPSDAATGDLAPLAGRTLDSFTIALGGTASISVPFFGDIGLANAHAIYEYPDFVEVGADYGLDLQLVKFGGSLNGFVLPSQHKFSFDSEVSACPNFKVKLPIVGTQTIDKPCFDAGVAISTKGVGLCGTVPIPFFTGAVPVTITVGLTWGGSPGVALFTCNLDPYKEANPRAAVDGSGRRGSAAAVQGFTLPHGLASAMVRIDGHGGAPDVTLTGPNNETVDTAHPPQNPNVVVLTQGTTTLIALKGPAGGSWSVAADAGSPPLGAVAFAGGRAAPRIEASVGGHGRHRTLSYRVDVQPGARVTFVERGPGTYHVLGIARGARGRIGFVPAQGRGGKRQILALLERAGLPAPSRVVATYIAPGFARPGRVARLGVSHRDTTVFARWRRTSAAAMYAVMLQTSDGSRVLRITRGAAVSFGGVSARLRGTVTIQGVSAAGARGPVTRAAFRAVRVRRR